MQKGDFHEMMSKFWHYLKGWKGIALICYMWLIMMAYVIVYMDVGSPEMKRRFYIVSVAEVILFMLIYICPKLLGWAEKIKLKADEGIFTQEQKRKFFLKSWLITFGILFVMYIIFYPGSFGSDAYNQYAQAKGFRAYNDWHPVLHTLFAFTLPLKLSGGWVGSIVLFQIMIFSLAFAYMLLTLAEYGNRKYSRYIHIYTLINPVTIIVLFPTKDVLFAVFAMLSFTCSVRIYFTDGEWLKNLKNSCMLIIFLTFTTIFRHNAILFTLPLVLAILLYAGRKQKFFVIAGCCAVVFVIRGVLYPYLGVEKPKYRVIETTGLPMTIIANAVYEAPEKLDKDIIDFFSKAAPKGNWKNDYSMMHAYSSIKHTNINFEFIEESGPAKILGIAFRCLIQAPFASLRGFAALTDLVYGIFGVVQTNTIGWAQTSPQTNTHENNYGIEDEGIKPLELVLIYYNLASRVIFKQIFWHVGVFLLLTLIFMLAKLSFKSKLDIKRLCLVLPIFAYDFGTMFFLTTSDFRFFWCTYLVIPLVLLLLLREDRA